MIDYTYTRTAKADGTYDIENHDRVDGGGKQIYLSIEIANALPEGTKFKVHSSGTTCTIRFDVTLSGAEETTLDGIVSDHINNI